MIVDPPFRIEEMMQGIQKFFTSEETRAPGKFLYDEVFDVDLFCPLQRKRELELMMRTAAEYSPKVVYEIGTCDGGGLYHWCKCLPTVKRVIAAEIRGTPYQHEFEKAFPDIDFLWISESSFSDATIERVGNWLGLDMIDAAFIDGDKSYFEKDFDVLLPWMSRPSVVFMHDVTDPAPGAAFKRVVERGFRTSTIIDRSESAEACDRMDQGIPPKNGHEGWLRHWKGASCGVGVIRIEGKP